MMVELGTWAFAIILGVVLVIAGFIITSIGNNRRVFQITGQALYFVGAVVVVIGLILLAAIVW